MRVFEMHSLFLPNVKQLRTRNERRERGGETGEKEGGREKGERERESDNAEV